MTEAYNKLVRDRIPEILDAKGIKYGQRIATAEEYKAELIKKLKEEVDEFLPTADPEELADVLEVVEAIKKLSDFKNVEDLRKKKFEERGGFGKRIILNGER